MNAENVLSQSMREFDDKLAAFMLGSDDALEREILRYINKNRNVAPFSRLQSQFVYRLGYCTTDKLRRRLDSLLKFNFILKEEYKGEIFYSIVKEKED